jgi:hypothetical protein
MPWNAALSPRILRFAEIYLLRMRSGGEVLGKILDDVVRGTASPARGFGRVGDIRALDFGMSGHGRVSMHSHRLHRDKVR